MSRSAHGRLACLAAAWLLALSGCQKTETGASSPAKASAGPTAENAEKPDAPPTTAAEVLQRMADAYKKAESYSDFGDVRLTAQTSRGEINWKANLSVKLARPNKLRLEANQGVVVTDGRKWNAFIRNLPGQFVAREAPTKLTLDAIFIDEVLRTALTQAFEGQIPELPMMAPQLVLLFDDEPLKSMFKDAEETRLLEPGRIGDTACHRVEAKWSTGATVLWIDQKTYALRRMLLPTAMLLPALGGEGQVQSISLVADFTGAELGAAIDPKAFQFQNEPNQPAEQVRTFLPPNMFQLLGKKAPEFKFNDLGGRPVTSQSVSGKVTLLAFWAQGAPACQSVMPELDKLCRKFLSNDKLAVYAVSMEPTEVDNKAVEQMAKDFKVTIPLVRDPDQQAFKDFRVMGAPTLFLLGRDGSIQYCEMDETAAFVPDLESRIDKLLAGQDLAKDAYAQYEQRLKRSEKIVDDAFQGKLPEEPKEAKPAPRSQPKTLKLTQIWKSADVKGPGNILVVPGSGGGPRIFVLDEGSAIVELGPDGKRIATYKPATIQPNSEILCNLRTGVGADGKRMYAAFAQAYQRLFWFDENWKQVAAYPEDALQNPHTGIASVELGDLKGDGKLKAYVGYYGAAGVQAVSPDGKCLAKNRALASVVAMAFSPPDHGTRDLLCANESGRLAILDAKLQTKKEVNLLDWPVGWILGAELKGDGRPLWAAVSVNLDRQTVILGLTLSGELLWSYPLPKGMPRQPVEPILAGRITAGGPGQWILPGCDGSIHFLSADGKPIDQFNYGVLIAGLATAEINGRPALLVASENGLEALRVE